MRLRTLVLPLAAAVISGMVWHKLSQDHSPGNSRPARATRIPAPAIEALDQNNSMTRLNSFRGRHNIFVVFFDGKKGADSDRTLQHLKQHEEELSAADFHVLAISSALPQQNRTTDFPPMFHLLTDTSWEIHFDWNCVQKADPRQAVFHVDRAGNIDRSFGGLTDVQVDALLGL